jgi:serine protease Do
VKFRRALIYSVLVAGIAFLLGLAWPDLVERAAYAVQSGQAAAAREQLTHARDLSMAFQDVAKAVRPSVVNVRSIKKVEFGSPFGSPRPGPFQGPSPFDEFFERFFRDRVPRDQQGNEFVQRGMGTGVIVSQDGYILTNNHVVGDADRITVTLSDNRELDAKVVGTDEKTDLAVLKIEGRDLLPAELGDSEAINVGEWVLAMGNPFGLSQTVTAGIVSAKGRANVGIADYEDFIQTDAAINPGNSGGPLVNLDGKVIGITTAIATRTGGYQGVGFAIPSNMAHQVMDSIIKQGKVVRGYLGVGIQNLTEDLAASFNFQGTEGALVGEVAAGGPGAEAGLEPGDIIVRFNGKKAEDMNKLRNMVAATAPGSKVDIQVVRNGQPKTFTVRIGELELQAPLARGGSIPDDLGVSVQDLTPELARQLHLEGQQGVLVRNVEPGGLAERAGLRPGDLVIAVGDRSVEDAADFRAALAEHDLKQGVRLRVKTQGMQRFVFMKR